MTAPRFSVIVPAYNSLATIDSCIRSVLDQRAGDLELLVVDDGSTDNTAEVVAAYRDRDPRVKLIKQANSGVSEARNTGIAHARGRYVGFLDHDDAWLPDYLELVGARFSAVAEAGVVYTDCWSLLDQPKRVYRLTTLGSYPPVDQSAEPDQLLLALLRTNFLTASSVTVARAVLEEVGGFSAEACPADDWDLWLRIASAGHRFVLAGAEPLVLLRETSTSQSKDVARMARGMVRTMERALANQPPGSESRSLAETRLAELRETSRRFENPTAAEALAARLRGAVRPFKEAATRRRTWRRPSPAVERALEQLGES